MSDPAEREIVRRTVNTDGVDPATQVIDVIADVESADPIELPTMYDCVDGMLDDLFSNPPAPDAQMTVAFSYMTYRVTVEQDGAVRLVKTE